jgi:IstB-like ATP binding protein
MTAAIRDAVSPDLRATLRALKLGQMLHTLPDRLTLARQQNMTHADFLELVLADEHARREAKSASLRARAAGLEAAMRLRTWDNAAAVRYDQQLWNELASLRSSTRTTGPCCSARRPWLTLRLSFRVVCQIVQADRVRPGYAGRCGVRW